MTSENTMPKKKIPREQLIVDFHIRGADTAVLSNTVLPVCLRRKEYCKYHIHIGGTLLFCRLPRRQQLGHGKCC